MIGLLARKRTNVTALAVMIALVAAMFVALQGARAAECVANPGITLGVGQTCTVTFEGATAGTGGAVSSNTSAATVTDPDANGLVTITAIAVGSTEVTINDLGDDNTVGGSDENEDDELADFDVEVVGFGIASVEVVGDVDNVVKAGADVDVRATLRSATGSSAVRLTVPTTGLSLDRTGGGTTQEQDGTATAVTGVAGAHDATFTVNTAGAPAGEYTLTFLADVDGFTADDEVDEGERVSATLTLTIGDPGAGLSGATLSLGNETNDKPYTDKDETVPEDGSEPASGGDVNLVIQAFDSLGGKSNSSAVNQIIVIAPGGSITATSFDSDADDDSVNVNNGSSSLTLAQTADTTPIGATTPIRVTKVGDKPGQVTVYAIVSGPGGAATTESITLNFTGAAASMSIADATETLLSSEEREIKLVVTAEDAGGNSTAPPTGGVSFVITDPNGKRQGSTVIGRSQPTPDGGKYLITLTGNGTSDSPLTAGVWTLTATQGKLEATANFSVAGGPSEVALTADPAGGEAIGDVITVTATVTDKDGNTVADGTNVQFSVSEDTGLAAIGTGHGTDPADGDMPADGKTTKNGSASVKYAVVGAGHSVVSAEAGGATGVVVVSSTAGSTDAMADEEVGLDCLTRLSGLTVYDCSTGSSASEIFALVASRGATALHLWNGADWVRYSVVDGNEVPGSLDFDIAENDSLWISN